MKVKKIIAAACGVCMLFTVAACGGRGGETGGGGTTPADTQTYSSYEQYTGGTHIYNYTETGRYIVSGGTSEYTIVYPAGVSGDIVTATTELSSWIENATGVDIGITTDEGLSYTSSSKYISLGDTAVAAAAQVALDEDVDVGFSGFQIKTKGESVFVLGETGSGVLFGTYELLYRLIGFVTYSGDEIYYESKTQVPLYDFDITDIPDFEYRVTAYGLSTYNAALANRLRYNQQEDVWIPVDVYNWHNTFKYLPPDDYKEAHPLWYDNADNPQQLCFLAHGDTKEADALYETLLTELIGYLDQYPERNNITITQEDVNVWCECEACNKQQEKYGTDAATIVQFCNRISEGVEAHYAELGQTRDINICFFAYHKTESAPVTLVDGEYVPVDDSVICRDNVVVFYAPIFADYSHSFYDTENQIYAETLDGWRVLSDRLYLWIYSTNFSYYFYPYNSFNSMQGNYWFALNHGGSYMFDQGQWNNYNSTGWGTLKTYLNSRLQWDSSLNMNDLIDDFFDVYFKDAAEPMKELFSMYRAHFSHMENDLGAGGGIGGRFYTSEYWPLGTLDSFLAKTDEAYAAIAPLQVSDPQLYSDLYDRICLESLAYRWMKITNYPSRFTNTALVAEQEAFKADCERLNVNKDAESSDATNLWATWGIS